MKIATRIFTTKKRDTIPVKWKAGNLVNIQRRERRFGTGTRKTKCIPSDKSGMTSRRVHKCRGIISSASRLVIRMPRLHEQTDIAYTAKSDDSFRRFDIYFH